VKTEVTYLSLTYDHAIIFFAVFAITGVPTAFAQERTAPTLPTSSQERVGTTKDSNKQDLVTLNFTNIEISALVKVISELTRRSFVIDERVTGKITLMMPTKVSPDEAYQVFLSALEIKGFTVVEDGKIIRIISTSTARQSGLKVFQNNDIQGAGFVTKLIRMKHVNPQEMVRTLTPLMTKDGSAIPYATTNSIIFTDPVSNIRKIEDLIRALDVPAPEGTGKINVYHLKNANAEDIAKIMQALVSRLPAATTAGATQSAGGTAQAAGTSTILEGAVTIAADKATNSLVIVGSPGDYETVKDVIQKLDIRRRQVYVEAAIIEMSLAKSRAIGFEFQSYNDVGSGKTSALGGTNFGNISSLITSGPSALSSLEGLTLGAVKGTFTYNGTEYLNVGALIHAFQSDSDVNVLSTPNLLTTDNQKAEIMVGENVPFITGQTQNAATSSTAILTSVERKDVGVTLKLTPQITSDDNVRLDIYQEISAVIDSPAGLNANTVGPSTSKRSASTTVIVKDRQTMVIGGLIKDNVTSTVSKVPLLGDIPLLGWLFRSSSKTAEKTNLMIFITPYIIKNEADAEEVTKKNSKSQEKFRKEFRIEKKSVEPISQASPTLSQQPEGRTGAVQKKDAGNALDPVAPAPPAAATKEDSR
jgi:general secretion pathway protein D